MRLMLTGATGFLGRHIVAAVQGHRTGHTLIRATRAGSASGANELALGPAPWQTKILIRALQDTQPDVVIHCAGATQSPDIRSCFEANTLLAADLLAAAGSVRQPPRIILIGSAAEYGIVAPDEQPVAETHACIPVTDYGIAKHAQTLLGLAAIRRGLRILVVRLFNPVGVGMPSHLALPSFAKKLVRPQTQAVLRVGDLSAQRDFIDVTEAARILVGLAEQPEWPWPLVNLCSGDVYKVGDLLNRMVAVSGLSVQIETDSSLLRPQDMPVFRGSTGRLADLDILPAAPDFELLVPRLLQEAHQRAAASAC